MTRNNGYRGNENIVYINQNIFFADRLTGTDFVKFVYRLDNKSREREKFFEFTERFDIDKKVDVKTLMEKQWGLLSGGERKYLYSMVLLSLDREWYILDEPFAYLDTEKKGDFVESHRSICIRRKGRYIDIT